VPERDDGDAVFGPDVDHEIVPGRFTFQHNRAPGREEAWLNLTDFGPRFAPKNPQLGHREVMPIWLELAQSVPELSQSRRSAMLRTRIAAVAAAALLFAATTAITAATAQTATSQPAGKPLQLVKIVERPARTTTKSHTKAVAKSSLRRSSRVATARPKKHAHVAALRRHRPQLPVKTAAATPTPAPTPVPTPPPVPDAIWPTANPAMASEITSATPAAQPAPAAPDPSEVVVAGQTVKVASPGEINEIDLGANHPAQQTADAAPVSVATGTPPPETSEPGPQSNAVKAFAARTRQPNDVGSASWILQVLAALGGAVTAGTVAWFLIGGTPQRTYG
jgi:hypothetical protein